MSEQPIGFPIREEDSGEEYQPAGTTFLGEMGEREHGDAGFEGERDEREHSGVQNESLERDAQAPLD